VVNAVTDPAVHHPVFARLYPAMAKAMERGGMAGRRASLLAGLTGSVLEIGAGDGLNLRHYPASVNHVIAVEPEPHLRRRAEAAAARAPIAVDVVDGLAERPVAGGSATPTTPADSRSGTTGIGTRPGLHHHHRRRGPHARRHRPRHPATAAAAPPRRAQLAPRTILRCSACPRRGTQKKGTIRTPV
jgi:hypothetical protein